MTDSKATLAEPVRDWLTGMDHAVLVTLRADGSPQTSNVIFHFDGARFRVSVTEDRAKTRNLRRDPRGLVHVLGENFWVFASVAVRASLGPVAESAGDGACQDLLDLYERVSGAPHPDPDEFSAAMVAEKRLVLSLEPLSVTGIGLPG